MAVRYMLRAVAAGALAVGALAGCSGEGTLKTSDVQEVIDDSPLKDQVKNLDCPDVAGKKGNTFECEAEIAGQKVKLKGEFKEKNKFEIVDVLAENAQ